MDKVLVFIAGLIAGVAFVHVAGRTPAGSRAVAAVNGITDEFLGALSDSYRARRAEGV